jgi:hypothetical protein
LYIIANQAALLLRNPAADSMHVPRVKKAKVMCIALNAVRVPAVEIVFAVSVVHVFVSRKSSIWNSEVLFALE